VLNLISLQLWYAWELKRTKFVKTFMVVCQISHKIALFFFLRWTLVREKVKWVTCALPQASRSLALPLSLPVIITLVPRSPCA